MISSIRIRNAASYDDAGVRLDDCKPVNFIFGGNGTGKSTLGKAIGNIDDYPGSEVLWSRNFAATKTLVFNREFIDRYLREDLPAVFTLGETNVQVAERIREVQAEIAEVDSRIRGYTLSRDGDSDTVGHTGRLADCENQLLVDAWAGFKRCEDSLGDAFTGFKDKKEKLKNEVLRRRSTRVFGPIPRAGQLSRIGREVFGDAPSEVAVLPDLDPQDIAALEVHEAIARQIAGREDVRLAAVIDRLEISDWVRQGVPHFHRLDGFCPFCQQRTPPELSSELTRYFDDSYESELQDLKSLEARYRQEADRLRTSAGYLLEEDCEFVDQAELRARVEALSAKIDKNLELLAAKRREPSRSLTLERTGPLIDAIREIVKAANREAKKRRELIENLTAARAALKSEVWLWFVEEELSAHLAAYDSRKSDALKAIAGLNRRIDEENAKREALEVELQNLHTRTVSIQPTVKSMNRQLETLGFSGFRLEVVDDESATYRISRESGNRANASLSEGEKNFVAFLYFYHLLSGSGSRSTPGSPRVVVVDDPVSSMDSDVLYVVSTLLREIASRVNKDGSQIQQLFVLTHNVYFHKEVTWRQNASAINAGYWVLRKVDGVTKADCYAENPVQGSYELLWKELSRGDASATSIQNTMRRILETYFRVFAGARLGDLEDRFEDLHDRLLCRSLISWLHDGSHNVLDDTYVSATEMSAERYQRVFRQIFEKTDQLGHYRHMTGEE